MLRKISTVYNAIVSHLEPKSVMLYARIDVRLLAKLSQDFLYYAFDDTALCLLVSFFLFCYLLIVLTLFEP